MRVSAVEGHRLWAPTYDSEANPIVALERRTMSDVLNFGRANRVVDVACGTGSCLLRFQEFASTVVGVDLCEAMLRQAMQHHSLRGKLLLGDVAHLPICDGFADLVVCSLALGYFPDLAGAFRELSRITSPNGRIGVSDLHPQAIASGWTRSLQVGGVGYQIENYHHEFDEVEYAASCAGLRLAYSQNAYLGDHEFPYFQRAGKSDVFPQVRSMPALLIHVWEKLC